MRIRSLKPDFFDDRVTGRWPDDLKMFYAGLWCYADDEGRFEWEPDLIRCKLYPFDPGRDVASLLERARVSGRISKYEVNGVAYGWIPSFKAHQHPDKPKTSKLPAPTAGSTIPASVPDASPTPSGSMLAGEEGRGEEGKPRRSAPTPPSLPLAEAKRTAWDRVNETWESVCVPAGFASARGTEKQRKAAGVRCRDPAWLEAFAAACRFLAREPFYRGKNDRGWAATLSWVLQAGKAEELAERAGTQKARKETPEDAAIRAAFEQAEREYESGAQADADPGPGGGRGGEGSAGEQDPSLPLPADGASLPASFRAVLGDRWPARELQDPAHVEHGAEHGAAAPPRPVRVP